MKTFNMRPEIYFNRGSLSLLSHCQNERVVIVSDATMAQFGYVDKIKAYLAQANSTAEVWTGAKPNPDVAVVTDCLATLQRISPSLLIALGGGSVIDTAKAALYMWRALCDQQGTSFQRPTFVAVPSTSGTGSEVTSFSVITDADGKKTTLIDAMMAPDMAILDPTCTNAIPYKVTVDTGLDVLTHAFEAYVSVNATDFSDAMAEKAVQVVFDCLPQLKENLDDDTARERMHNASCLAGAAFENAGLGINHSLAHALGGYWHLPHGRANALLIEGVIQYNADLNGSAQNRATDKYAHLAKILALPARTAREGVVNLIAAVTNLKQSLDVPLGIAGTDIPWDDYESALETLVTQALADRCTPTNPRTPSPEDLRNILIRAF